MKLIVYGDIHGCLDEFIKLREKISPKSTDYEVCAGDMINKGPYSKETLSYIIENSLSAVMGNHEEKFLKFNSWLYRELGKVELRVKQKELFMSLDEEQHSFLATLPYFIKVSNVTVMHGGVWQDARLNGLNRKNISKIAHTRYVDKNGHFLSLEQKEKKDKFWSEIYDGREGFIIYGHQVFKIPRFDRFSLGIDTGCVYGNMLSAAVVELKNGGFATDEIEVYQQKAKKAYAT